MMNLPDTLDWRAFISLDGRETTEAQVLGAAAEEFLKTAYASDDLARVRVAVDVLLFRFAAALGKGPPDLRASMFLLGVFEGALYRRAWRGLRSLAFRAIRAYLDHRTNLGAPGAARFYPDYVLGGWYVNGMPFQAKILWDLASGRSEAEPAPDAAEIDNAKMIVARMRAEDPEFDSDIRRLEQKRLVTV